MPNIPDSDSRLQDILFHELHHRFYNSLQVVSAAVGLLADHRHPEEIALLRDRIGTLGALHRTLARPLVDLADMRAAFEELCTSLTRGFARGKVTLRLERMTFPRDPMIVRGLTLMLVELVTNALKHGNSGKLNIRVIVSGFACGFRLTVANTAVPGGSGAGSPPYVATRFAEAMGGTLSVVLAPEHIVCVTVPIAGAIRAIDEEAR